MRGAADEVEPALAQLLVGLGDRVEELELGVEALLLKKPSSTAAIAGKYEGEMRSGIATRRCHCGFDSGRLHGFLPEREVVADRLRELGRRAAHRVDADLVQPRDEGGVLAAGGDLARDALDDLARRAGRRDVAVPGHGAEAGIALLGDRRHVGQLRRARFRRRRRARRMRPPPGVRNELVQLPK